MKPKNVFISLDGDHYAETVYHELVYYQRYLPTIGNIMVAQDARLSSKWHTLYCSAAKFDGPCNGPLEAVNWFLKNEGKNQVGRLEHLGNPAHSCSNITVGTLCFQ